MRFLPQKCPSSHFFIHTNARHLAHSSRTLYLPTRHTLACPHLGLNHRLRNISHTHTHLPSSCHRTGHKLPTLPLTAHTFTQPSHAPGHRHTGSSQVEFQTGPVPGGQRETEKAGHSRMQSGGFKWGELTYVLGTERQKLHARPPGS